MRHIIFPGRRLLAAAWLTALSTLVPGCGGESVTVVFVTVDARAEMQTATDLAVSIINDDAELTQEFSITGESFPVTFTITPTDREGDLVLSINAFDQTGDPPVLRAHGTGSTAIIPDERADLRVVLEPSDFVINSAVDGEQTTIFPTSDDEPSGRQIAVGPDGSFVVTFVENCDNGSCDVLARRFNADTTPALNAVTGNTDQFVVNPTPEAAQIIAPAIASGPSGSLVAWLSGNEVRAVLLGVEAGRITTTELIVSEGANPTSEVHVAGMASGDFLVVWRETLAENNHLIRGRFIDDSGALASGPFAISTSNGFGFRFPVAAGGDNGRECVIVWHDGSELFARFYNRDGTALTPANVQLTDRSGTFIVYGHDVAWVSGAAMVSWGVIGDAQFEDGSVLMRRFVGPDGTPDSPEAVLAPFTATDFGPPAIAARADGIVATAWHNCEANGDSSGCGVFVQAAHPFGLPIGSPILANTAQLNDQRFPSVTAADEGFLVAWRDESGQAPDTSMSAVRGRAVYTTAGEANGQLGAPCTEGSNQCDAGLVCMAGAESEAHCHRECDAAATEPCPGGGICTPIGGSSGCLF